MKRTFEYIGIIIIMVFILFYLLYFNNDIGAFKSNIEKNARSSQKIDDNWEVAKSTTDSMSAMLFYDKDINDYTFSIYVNKRGLSFGYFFRGGGSTNVENEGIAQYQVEGYQEKAYLSMNHQEVVRIEIDNGNMIETIDIDHTKPFSIILPDGIGSIRFYDVNDEILKPIPQLL